MMAHKASKRIYGVFSLVMLLSFVLAESCSASPAGTKTVLAPTTSGSLPEIMPALTSTLQSLPTRLPQPSPNPPAEKKRLVICQADIPTSLYYYSDPSLVLDNIFDLILPGAIQVHNYHYEAVILEQLPSLENGDAVIEWVELKEEDPVWKARGGVIPLSAGAKVMTLDGETLLPFEITYAGGSIRLPRLRVRFTIKANIRWSDGHTVSVEDSLFSFALAQYASQHLELGLYPDGANRVERTQGYHQVGDRTVEWVGYPGDLSQDYFLNFYEPLPQHQVEKETIKTFHQSEVANFHPPGWGPFQVVEFSLGGGSGTGYVLRLQRNPYYYRSAEGLPKVDEVIFKFIPQSEEASAVANGECQVGTLHGLTWDKITTYREMEARGRVRLLIAVGIPRLLVFGPGDPDQGLGVFTNRLLRQAVARAINRQGLSDNLKEAFGPPPDGFLPVDHPDYGGESISKYPYDPEVARQFLVDAGWNDTDGDGILDKEGHKLSVYAVVREGRDVDINIMEQIKADLGDIGIEVSIEQRQVTESWVETLWSGTRFDLALMSINPEPQSCLSFTSDQTADAVNNWVGANLSGYANPAYDSACQAGTRSLDPQQAHVALIQAQAILSQDLPVLPLVNLYPWMELVDSGLAGFEIDPSHASELWSVELVEIK